MRKTALVIAVILALLGVALGAGLYIQKLKGDLGKERAKRELLQAAQKLSEDALDNAAAARIVENEKAKEREALMQKALEANCDWSGIELPPDVVRLLRQGADGAGGVCPPAGAAR